jgi:hypothetical protein
MNRKQHSHFDVLTEEAVKTILGIGEPVPLSPKALSKSLRVTFFPTSSASERVLRFVEKLRLALAESGVTILEYAHALSDGPAGKLREGVVIIAPGELQTGDLPVDHVSNLRKTTVVGIIDGPCPADRETDLQEKLNSVVKTLAWNIVQVVIYVDDDVWTIATMNGAIIRLRDDGKFTHDVFSTLIPKLAAPVVPPHSADFEVHEGALNLSSSALSQYVRDFVESGRLWARSGLLLFHTTMDSLDFRNRFYKRLAAAYLDHRSGMSYGFLARQIATPVEPALTFSEAQRSIGPLNWDGIGLQWLHDRLYVGVRLSDQTLVAEVPAVRVLTTRSGCDKSNIDAHRDLVMLGLSRGRVILETPKGISAKTDCKPSYDTMTILSHAVANSLVASVLSRLRPRSTFAAAFQQAGMALAHWHGEVDRARLPKGYAIHGDTNPPVSCSTHQAAMYALTGKMNALRESIDSGADFYGDVHVEPHHGINVTGESLLVLARWATELVAYLRERQTGARELLHSLVSNR